MAFVILASLGASSCQPAEGQNPQFWTSGIATTDRMWLRDVSGSVVEFDRYGRRSSRVVATGVVNLARQQGRVVGLRRTNGAHSFEVDDLRTGARLAPVQESSGDPLALVLDGDDLVVITSTDLFRLQRGRWTRTPLSEALGRGAPAHQISAASDNAGAIYVAFNAGEWGGSVQTISVSTGRVGSIRNGLPATGLARDTAHRGCVLVSQGLMHLGEEGRIIRACGVNTSVIFTETVPPPRGLPAGAGAGTRSFFGIIDTTEGWMAASPGMIVHSDRERVTRQSIPAYQTLGHLRVAAVGTEVVVVQTDANGGQSLSGPTPLLLKVER